jgi:hypothetical protein
MKNAVNRISLYVFSYIKHIAFEVSASYTKVYPRNNTVKHPTRFLWETVNLNA